MAATINRIGFFVEVDFVEAKAMRFEAQMATDFELNLVITEFDPLNIVKLVIERIGSVKEIY